MRGHPGPGAGGLQHLGHQVELGRVAGVAGAPTVQGAREGCRVAAVAALQGGELHPPAEGVRGCRPILFQGARAGSPQEVPDDEVVAREVAVAGAVALCAHSLAGCLHGLAQLHPGVGPDHLGLPAVGSRRLLRVGSRERGQGLLGAPLGEREPRRDNVGAQPQCGGEAPDLRLGMDPAGGGRVPRGEQGVGRAQPVAESGVLAPGLCREAQPAVRGLAVASRGGELTGLRVGCRAALSLGGDGHAAGQRGQQGKEKQKAARPPWRLFHRGVSAREWVAKVANGGPTCQSSRVRCTWSRRPSATSPT